MKYKKYISVVIAFVALLGITSCNNIRSNINFQVDTTDIFVPDTIKFIVNFDEGSQSFRSYKLRGKESIGVFIKEQSGKMLLNNAQFTNNKDEHELFTTNQPDDILLTDEHEDLTYRHTIPTERTCLKTEYSI
ncbi:MAG: hypothetical protein Q4A76_01025 [Porphyromonadaceae bacterium]|nr:hypothetical protein [Porphyromonadaceae bacterium]